MQAGNNLSGSTEWLRELSRIGHPALLQKFN